MSDIQTLEARILELKGLAATESAALKQARRDLKAAQDTTAATAGEAAKVQGLQADLAAAKAANETLKAANASLTGALAKAEVKAGLYDTIKNALA